MKTTKIVNMSRRQRGQPMRLTVTEYEPVSYERYERRRQETAIDTSKIDTTDESAIQAFIDDCEARGLLPIPKPEPIKTWDISDRMILFATQRWLEEYVGEERLTTAQIKKLRNFAGSIEKDTL